MPPKQMHHRAAAKMEREATKAVDDQQRKAKAADDAKWAGEGLSKAELRHQEKMQKAQDKQIKSETKKMLKTEEEDVMASVKLTGQAKKNLRELGEYTSSGKAAGSAKVTQFELRQRQELEAKEREAEAAAAERKKEKILDDLHLGENTNHLLKQEYEKDVAQYGAGNVIQAHGVSEALAAGASIVSTDKGAQKRKNKRAYKDFEEAKLKELREDYPELKLSQLKEKCFAEFQRQNNNEHE